MLLRVSRFLAGFLDLALLATILVVCFKEVTATRNKTAPGESSFCDSRIIILVDDSSRGGNISWAKNEGTSELYVLDTSNTNCNPRGKRRKQLEKKMTPRTPTTAAGVSSAGLTIGREPGDGVLGMVAGTRNGTRLLSDGSGGLA